MAGWLDFIMALLVLLTLLLVVTSRLSRCIRILLFEGVLLAALPPLVALVRGGEGLSSALLFAVAVLALKAVFIPRLLTEAVRRAKVEQELEPFIGFTRSLMAVAVAFLACRLLTARLPWPVPAASDLMAPVAFFLFFAGLFLIVSRVKAISQVIGYVQVDAGVFVFGMAYPYQQSLLVEAAVLLDGFVAVMVMGIAIYQINRTFDHIDVNRMSVLRDFRR